MKNKPSIFDLTGDFSPLKDGKGSKYLTYLENKKFSGLGDCNIVVGDLNNADIDLLSSLKNHETTLYNVLRGGLGIFFCSENSGNLKVYNVFIPEINKFLKNIRHLVGKNISAVKDDELIRKLEQSGHFDKYSTILETESLSVPVNIDNKQFGLDHFGRGVPFKIRCDAILRNPAGENVGLHIKYFEGDIFLLPQISNKIEVVQEIINYTNGLTSEEAPGFLEKTQVFSQIKLSRDIKKINSKIKKQRTQLKEKEEEHDNYNKWKDLLWQTDKALEHIVKDFFKEFFHLDFEPHFTDDGEEIDLVGDHEESRIIIEVKGKTGCINLKEDVRQAIDRVTQFAEEWDDPKVMMVVNPYRLKELDRRPPSESEQLVADHATNKASINGIGIILTTDIFDIIQDILRKKLTKKEQIQLLEEIFKSKGLYRYIKKQI